MNCTHENLLTDGGPGWYKITCADCPKRWTGGTEKQVCLGCSQETGVTYGGSCEQCDPRAGLMHTSEVSEDPKA